MIFGRPTNLWLGAFTAIWNVIALTTHGLISPDVVNGVNVAAGSVILLIAVQPPTVPAGTIIKVKPSNGGEASKLKV